MRLRIEDGPSYLGGVKESFWSCDHEEDGLQLRYVYSLLNLLYALVVASYYE
jgi:hypothetical protein